MQDIKLKIGVLVINNSNELLLIREKIKKNNKYLWNIIKGTYEGNEDIFSTALREAKEEACIEIRLINSLSTLVTREESKIRVQFNFLAKIKSGIPSVPPIKEQKLRDEDISEVKLFKKEELLKMRENQFISLTIYRVVQNWINDQIYPLDTVSK